MEGVVFNLFLLGFLRRSVGGRGSYKIEFFGGRVFGFFTVFYFGYVMEGK